MKFTVYHHSNNFWEENQEVIAAHILDAELVYLNARNNIGVEQGFFGAVIADQQGVLFAVQTRPYPMMFFANGRDKSSLSAAMIDYLIRNDAIPQQINGDKASTDTIISAFLDRGIRYSPYRGLVQRKCEVLLGEPKLPLSIVNANDIDYDFSDAYHEFLVESHVQHDPDKMNRDLQAMLTNRDLYALIDNNEVVAMGRLQRKLPHGREVGVIYTPPRFRGKGYSTCCVRQLTQRVFDDGNAFAYLYAEADNQISNHVYEKLGYLKTSDFIEYHLDHESV